MSIYQEAGEKAVVEGFEIEMRLDCTIKVGEWDFVKPGVSSKVKFTTLPTEKQIKLSMTFMNDEILEPTLEDVITEIQKKLKQSRE